MHFELRHLRNFVVVAEELHFGRAANRLAMSQPPLSVSIQQLEDIVGTRLLERDSKGVRLTAAGEAFRDEAKALLAKAEEARILAREIGAGAVGRLRVGFVGSLLYCGLPQWVRTFQARHPRIDVVLIEQNSGEQIESLQRGDLDLGFILARRVPETLAMRPLFSEPFLCCLPNEHPLARKRQISLAMLRDEPFVLFSQRASPDYHARIVEMCAAAGYAPRVRHELRHWLSVIALVSQGDAVSIVPAPLRHSGMAGVCYRGVGGLRLYDGVFVCVARG
jgi:DNA-binding transcriptional LysR family regulator